MVQPDLPDYHVHTPLCRHAVGDVREYVAAAAAAGLPEICFTDHAPAPDGYDPSNRMLPDQYPEYVRDVRDVQGQGAPRVLLGIEADYYPGGVEFLKEWLPQQPLDLVLGSVHYIASWAFDDPGTLARWDAADVESVWRDYFGLVGRLAQTRLFDVLGHPDLPKKFGHRAGEATLRETASPALDLVAAAGMALEINTSGLRKPVGEMYPSLLVLSLARERGIPICFGSDAHRPGDVGAGFAQALALARQAGYEHGVRFEKRIRSIRPLPLA